MYVNQHITYPIWIYPLQKLLATEIPLKLKHEPRWSVTTANWDKVLKADGKGDSAGL